MLLHIGDEVVEIRPSELFESKTLVDSRHLELISKPVKKKKASSEKKKPQSKTFIEESHGTSSST
tara:strand:- start:118 stop:312 length:195 start_codon:yes stop_codon:yes gene_type:complete